MKSSSTYLNDLKKRASEDRHSLKNCVAACRLFQGFVMSGDASERNDTYIQSLFDSLSKIDKINNIGKDFLGILKNKEKIKKIQQNIENIGDQYNAPINTDGKKLLIIDDMVENAGWENVLNAILGDNSLLCANSVDNGKRLAVENRDDIFAILIDLKFGDEDKKGLELVEYFYSKYEFLPLIIFSASDSVIYLKSGFKKGAWEYFAKEPDDKIHHDALGYYLEFRNIMKRMISYNKDFYNEFFPKINKIENVFASKEYEQNAVFRQQLVFHLKKAYNFLIQGETDRYSVSYDQMNQHSEAVFQMSVVLETFCVLYMLEKNITKRIIDDSGLSNIFDFGFGLSSKINSLINSDKSDELDENWKKNAKLLVRYRNDIVHTANPHRVGRKKLKINPSKPIDLNKAKKMMGVTLDLVKPEYIYGKLENNV